ncbi:MAG: nucleotide sugar dehydrogenase [Dehalococcoidales bacterium]|nr:nucleotide sugar dehydrogenase [Dehalococcoidales bacterium]
MKILGLEKETIVAALTHGQVTMAIYGLGKMGLPLAVIFADKGARVIGVDSNQRVVDAINAGECPVAGEPGLPEMLQTNVAGGRLTATSDGVSAAREADVMVVLVPSLLNADNSPDLSAVTQVCLNVSRGMTRGDIVILETTVPPRTTEDVLLPILKQSGLKEGEFGLAFCPERTSSGRAIQDITRSYVKVIGGIDAASTATAAAIYSVINEKGVRTVSSATVAEAVKVFEGVYRDVNIALSNELALVCKEIGVDPVEVFTVANEPLFAETGHPYTTFLQPGAGVGGHCIPVYPYFVTRTVKSDTSLIKTARRRNESMPTYVVNMIIEGLNEVGRSVKDSNILVLGLAFRNGVKEFRYSPTIPIIQRLRELRANIFLYDPLYSREEIEALGSTYTASCRNMDCLVIVTDHKEFKTYDWSDISRQMRSKVIIDGRQIVDPSQARKLGFVYKGIGHL